MQWRPNIPLGQCRHSPVMWWQKLPRVQEQSWPHPVPHLHNPQLSCCYMVSVVSHLPTVQCLVQSGPVKPGWQEQPPPGLHCPPLLQGQGAVWGAGAGRGAEQSGPAHPAEQRHRSGATQSPRWQPGRHTCKTDSAVQGRPGHPPVCSGRPSPGNPGSRTAPAQPGTGLIVGCMVSLADQPVQFGQHIGHQPADQGLPRSHSPAC